MEDLQHKLRAIVPHRVTADLPWHSLAASPICDLRSLRTALKAVEASALLESLRGGSNTFVALPKS